MSAITPAAMSALCPETLACMCSRAPSFTGIDKRYTLQFHLDAESLVTLTMVGPSTVGESLSWSRMILASKQDYDAMRALTDANGQPLNIEWFDGDTYPR